MKKVLIGEIHPITLAGFDRAVAMHPHLQLVAACRDAESLLEAAEREPEAVCVVDPEIFLRRPSLYGRLVESRKRILVWTASETGESDPEWDPVLRAWVLSKQATREALLRAIVLAAHGPGASTAATRPAIRLTPREREIAAAAAAGLQNKEIAARCGIAPGTVKIHMHSIYQKLGIETRSQLPAALAASSDSRPLRIAALARAAAGGRRRERDEERSIRSA
jgi:DNA-binding NarL/FixJ family response regulator